MKILRSRFEIFLFIAVLAAHLYVAFSPANSLMNWYTTDDAFYYFKTAQNIGLGRDISFDGLSRTNGFHPLWMIICVPIFLLANLDLILPLRIVVVLAGIMNAATAILIYRMFKTNGAKLAGFAAALFWAFSIQVHFVTVTLGMESTVNALTVTLLIYLASQIDFKKETGSLSISDFSRLGYAAIFTFLSRIDNGFLVAAILIWVLIKHRDSLPASGESPKEKFARWMKLALTLGLPVGITLLVYLGFNKIYFGTETPVSGQIKRWWGTLPNTVYGFPVDNYKVFLTHLVTPQVNIGPFALLTQIPHDIAGFFEKFLNVTDENQKSIHRLLVLISSVVMLAAAIPFVKRGWKSFKDLVGRFYLLPFFIACMAQIYSYKSTTYIETLTWYWVSEMVLIVISGGVLLNCFIEWLQEKSVSQWFFRVLGTVLVLLLVIPFSGYIFDLFTYRVNPADEEAYLSGARALEQYTEPGSIIGTTGGGIVAYFIKDRTIVNLDGLINSNDYFQRMRRGKTGEYFDRIGLDYVYGNIYMITESDPYARMFYNRVELIGTVEGASLFRYIPGVPAKD